MSDAPKDNREILENQAAFVDAFMRASELFKGFDGVVSVGYGQKETDGVYREEIAIIVYVREKKPEEVLAPVDRIPKTFEGYRTDVVVVPSASPLACENQTRYDVIQGGIQIAPGSSGNTFSAGTLACIVRKRNDAGRDNVYLLSCKHVLFDTDSGVNDVIYHPKEGGTALGPVQEGSMYGVVHATVAHPTSPGGLLHADFFIDCAVARIDIDSPCCGSTCTQDTIKTAESIDDLALPPPDNRIADVRNLFGDIAMVGTRVFKVGRTTRKTKGILRTITPVNVRSDFQNKTSPLINAPNLLKIDFDPDSTPSKKNCDGLAWFGTAGDSGSLVLDEQGRAVGLLTFGPHPGDPDPSPAFASFIVPVLDHLSICIPTMPAGKSHGSSNATDGSGHARLLNDADPSKFPAGKIVFTAETAEPVNDAEQQHMRALLERLRATRRGRELHDLFGRHRREIGYLIRNHKLVKAAWHRHKGPALLAHVLNHLKGHADRVPREVDGVSAITLITHMADLLMRYGSNPLRDAIRGHYDQGLHVLSSHDFDSAGDCIAWLERLEAAA